MYNQYIFTYISHIYFSTRVAQQTTTISTRLDFNVRIKTRIRTEVTQNRICANAHNSGHCETRDNPRRTDRASDSSRLCLDFVSALSRLHLGFASATSRLCLTYASTTPWLRSPASIVARHAITLIVCLGT